jgi:acyl-CoA synthetase (NDP forming)
MYWQEAPALALRAADVPVYRDTGSAIAALSIVAGRPEATGVPELPTPTEPWTGSGYLDARRFVEDAALRFPRALHAATPHEAHAAASEVGYPVVLKALGVMHKSDAGGVALGLEGPEALASAAAAMEAPEGYSVEQMMAAPSSVELIAGCRRDRRLGPVLLLGFGGIFAEVLRDTAVALAPAEPATVERLLLGLRGASLLTGARGRPPLALRAAAEAGAALSVLAAQHPELDEIEINPLLVTRTDAIALDARVVHSQPR